MVRMDATKNEVHHPKVHINSFPTFYFFSVGDQDNPIEYDGERSVEAILNFIETFRSRWKSSQSPVEGEKDVAGGEQKWDNSTEDEAGDSEMS